MLIVNADDFGVAPSATDAILDTFDAGVISSASAMVWMPDSERASAIARERGLALGLHLNLSRPLDDPGVPAPVAERQLRMTEHFGSDSWWRGKVRGVRPAEVQAVLDDQLEEFRLRFGEPTHINGHHHVHLTDVVLELLPRDVPIRQVPTTPGRINDSDRRMARIRVRFRAPWATLDVTSIHPALGGNGLELLPEWAQRPLEIVAHPQQAAQKEALMDATWRDAVAVTGLGTFEDL